MKSIRAFAPATIANFNVGYDVLGASLNNIGDEVVLTINGTKTNAITEIENGDFLPKEVNKNCCSVVIRKMQEVLGEYKGVDIRIVKGFASGSGMGSSSASSAAAAFGYNELVGRPFTKKELIKFAAEGERVACGSAHVDNVAPSILGGFVLATGSDVDCLIELPVLDDLYAITLFPKISIKTSDSRGILKDNIGLSTASQQVALMGAFVSSLYDNDIKRFSSSLQDLMIEPIRSLLIPKFEEMRTTVHNNGGLAFGISGSGPSVFAICKGEENGLVVKKALEDVYEDLDIESQTYINALTKESGARIL